MLNFLAVLNNLVHGRIERDDEGATAVEYGLMVALISVAIIAAVTIIGTELAEMFDRVADALVAIV